MSLKMLLFASFVAVGMSTPVFATNETEKGELIRITKEIKFLKSEVSKIKSLKRVDDTESFNYQALLSDLDKISSAIERHVKAPSRQPRKIKPLVVDYDDI